MQYSKNNENNSNQRPPFYENFVDTDNSVYIYNGINNACNAHFHQRFELDYVTQGNKSVIVNGVKYPLKQHQIAFVYKYYIHSFISDNTCSDINYIPSIESTNAFNNDFCEFTLPTVLDDVEFNKSQLLEVFSALTKPYNSYKHNIVNGYTLILFDKLLEHYKKIPIVANKSVDMIVNILNYIDNNYSENITLDNISANFAYNKFYFSKLFNQCVGQSLKSYINSVRVRNFVKTYTKNKHDITKLAHDCGFNSLTAFYRCFDEIYKCSPSQYFDTTYISSVLNENSVKKDHFLPKRQTSANKVDT